MRSRLGFTNGRRHIEHNSPPILTLIQLRRTMPERIEILIPGEGCSKSASIRHCLTGAISHDIEARYLSLR